MSQMTQMEDRNAPLSASICVICGSYSLSSPQHRYSLLHFCHTEGGGAGEKGGGSQAEAERQGDGGVELDVGRGAYGGLAEAAADGPADGARDRGGQQRLTHRDGHAAHLEAVEATAQHDRHHDGVEGGGYRCCEGEALDPHVQGAHEETVHREENQSYTGA